MLTEVFSVTRFLVLFSGKKEQNTPRAPRSFPRSVIIRKYTFTERLQLSNTLMFGQSFNRGRNFILFHNQNHQYYVFNS